ncbi:MAG: PepSY domain-containing protein [Aeromicrobium sp.]
MKTLTGAVLGLVLALSLTACGDDISSSDRERASEAALRATGATRVNEVELGHDNDKYAFEVEVRFTNGAEVDVELDENFKVINSPPTASDFSEDVSSTSEPTAEPNIGLDADDRPLTGETFNRASAAALKATGTGKVIETGGSDDRDHAYEVDVLLPNGEDVTIELDEKFKVTEIDR